jgi:GT2 family glycosyltransferase
LICFAFGLGYLAPNSSIFNSESYGGWSRDSVREVDIVTGCFLMIDRKFWQQLGGFDPLFFMYGEEADLCYRARRLGARPTITPNATIIHFESASDVVPLEKRIKVFRARISLIDRQMWPVTRDLGRLLHLLAPLTRWWCYRFGAFLTGRRELDQTADHWRAIWERRSEWRRGFAREVKSLAVHRIQTDDR